MKRTFILLFFSILSFCASAQNKLDHTLSAYAIHIDIDSAYWRRVSYKEMHEANARYNRNLDEFLKEQPYIAHFYYVPKDSLTYPLASFITIDVTPLDKKVRSIYERSDSSMNSNTSTSFLSKISGGDIDKGFGKKFKDEHTGTILYKFLTYMSVRKDNNSKFPEYVRMPNHFLIAQTKIIGNNIVTLEYHCYEHEQQDYFPRFEKIIRTFH